MALPCSQKEVPLRGHSIIEVRSGKGPEGPPLTVGPIRRSELGNNCCSSVQVFQNGTEISVHTKHSFSIGPVACSG